MKIILSPKTQLNLNSHREKEDVIASNFLLLSTLTSHVFFFFFAVHWTDAQLQTLHDSYLKANISKKIVMHLVSPMTFYVLEEVPAKLCFPTYDF